MSELTSEGEDLETENYEESVCYSELEAAETASTVSSVACHLQEIATFQLEQPAPSSQYVPHLVRQLARREMGFGGKEKSIVPPVKTFTLNKLFPEHVLSSHVFMGMTRCGRYLLTYTVQADSFEDEWYSTEYKYMLHWWLFKPHSHATKCRQVQLFGSENIVAFLQISVCQWPTVYDRVLVYGLMKDNGCTNQRAFVTVTAVPATCSSCIHMAGCSSCLKTGYTVHTSFDITVPYPEFKPRISLKYADYVVFNTNNTLHALRVNLDDGEGKNDKNKRGSILEPLEPLQLSPSTSSKLQEQIIRDFETEDASSTLKGFHDIESLLSPPLPTRLKTQANCLSPPLPTRLKSPCDLPIAASSVKSPSPPWNLLSPPFEQHQVRKDDDIFLSPQHIVKTKRIGDNGSNKKRLGSFFTHLRRDGSMGLFISQSASTSTSPSSSSRKSSPYEFVDDSQHEVEKLSQFRRKRLAEKTYEFQECDSENIVPFSQARLLSPRKSDNDEPQVLRPLNRNSNTSTGVRSISTNGNTSRYPSFGNEKVINKNAVTSCTGTGYYLRFFRNRPEILVHDVSGRYGSVPATPAEEARLYAGLLKMGTHRFRGSATRVVRFFLPAAAQTVANEDEDDDISSNISGYHTVLNLEVIAGGKSLNGSSKDGGLHRLRATSRKPGNASSLLWDGHYAIHVEQQTLDIEAICQSVATCLCTLVDKTFKFCNDYDVEVLDVCPRSGDVLVLLMLRIEATSCDPFNGEPMDSSNRKSSSTSTIEQFEASVSFIWNLQRADYKINTVVPPQKVQWVWNDKSMWSPAKEASRRFVFGLPDDISSLFSFPYVRVCSNSSTFRGISLPRIFYEENSVQFVL